MAKPNGVVKRGELSVATWEQRLQDDAKVAAASEAQLGDKKFAQFKGGIFIDKVPQPNSEIGVIILDAPHVNTLYTKAYNPTTPEAPACFAIGRGQDGSICGVDNKDTSVDGMAPHRDAQKPQCADCATCKFNQWGSAELTDPKKAGSKGKACQNTRRLAFIVAGTFTNGKWKPFTKAEEIMAAPIIYGKVSPTNTKAYSAYVNATANVIGRPPYAVFTKIRSVPDTKDQYKLVFETLGNVEANIGGAVMDRVDEAKLASVFGFTGTSTEDEPAAPATKKKARNY